MTHHEESRPVTEPDTTPSADQPTGANVPTASDDSPAPRSASPSGLAPEAKKAPEKAAPPKAAPKSQAGLTGKGRVRHTRVSALYVGLIVAAILSIFLLIFIIQNSAAVTIQFLGFEGEVSLAVALLLAAVSGILVVAVPGSLRILQLRRALRKNAKD
jgi:uncharacterized integral membrane protein